MNKQVILPHELCELFGLAAKDVDVYLSLLSLGNASLRRVAEQVGLNRGTTYDALKHLQEFGLVGFVDAKKHRIYMAEDPHKLRGLVRQREVALQEAREELTSILPVLERLSGSARHRPVVRYYEGASGVRDILEDVLQTTQRAESKMYRVYSSAGIRDLITSAWPQFVATRIRKGVRVRAIAIGEGGRTVGLDERRWLSKNDYAPAYIFIYADKTAHVFVSTSGELFGVLIEDNGLAQTQRLIFESVWKGIQE